MSQISRLKDAEISNGNLINADDIDAELNQLVAESNTQDTRLTSLESSAMTIAGVKTFSSAPKLDQIDERTTNTGVTIDQVLLKDGAIRVPGSAGYAPTANGDLGYDSTAHAYKLMVNGVARTLKHDGNTNLPKGYMQGKAPTYNNTAGIIIPTGLKVRSSDNTADIEVASDITLSLAISGAGGLDAGAEAANTHYYVYLIKKSSDGTVSALFSTVNEQVSGAITLPTGYDLKRQLPVAVRNDASSNIIPFDAMMTGNVAYVQYQTNFSNWDGTTYVAGNITNVLSAGTSTSDVDVSCASYVPGIATRAEIYFSNLSGNTGMFSIRKGGSSAQGTSIPYGSGAGGAMRTLELDSSKQFRYKRTNGTAVLAADVSGYWGVVN